MFVTYLGLNVPTTPQSHSLGVSEYANKMKPVKWELVSCKKGSLLALEKRQKGYKKLSSGRKNIVYLLNFMRYNLTTNSLSNEIHFYHSVKDTLKSVN